MFDTKQAQIVDVTISSLQEILPEYDICSCQVTVNFFRILPTPRFSGETAWEIHIKYSLHVTTAFFSPHRHFFDCLL